MPGIREFRVLRFDGLYRWFYVRTIPMLDNDGNIVEWFGSNTDIQEVHELHETSLAEADRFARIVETAPGVICEYLLGPDGSVGMSFASPKIVEIYGIEPVELARDASGIMERIHPDDRQLVIDGIAASAETLSMWQATFRVRHPERHGAHLDPSIPFLQKPFRPDTLLTRLREIFDSSSV